MIMESDLKRIDAFMESVAKGLYPNFVEFLRYGGDGRIPERMEVNDDVQFIEEIIDLSNEGRRKRFRFVDFKMC